MDLRDKLGVNKNIYNEVICPVCGQVTLDSYWICDNCNWEYDDTTDENEYSCVNHGTIRSYKEKMGLCENPTVHFNVLPENLLDFADFLSLMNTATGLVGFDMQDFENVVSKSKQVDFYCCSSDDLLKAEDEFENRVWCYSPKSKVLAVIGAKELPDAPAQIEQCNDKIVKFINPCWFYWNVYETEQKEKYKRYVLVAD